MKLLIVEDDAVLALDVAQTALRHGYASVGIANCMSQARQHADAADLALVDIHLDQGESGLPVGETLARDHGLTVVFLTANPEVVERGVKGTVGVLTKPHTTSSLIDALDYAAGRRKGLLPDIPPHFKAFL